MIQGKLYILSAPSGTGKSTLLDRIMAEIEGLAFSVSHTTRTPRKGEKTGVEYHFIDRQTFVAMIDRGDFLEYADVHGNLYGTSRPGVQQQIDQGVDVILDIDVQGADIIRKCRELNTTFIFLAPPSLDELEKRLRGRGLDDEETIATRLANAADEMTAVNRYDYVIVNENVEEAAMMLKSVILAERAKDRRTIRGEQPAVDGIV
ncbi:MAG: guanylate kinase [Desulfopila sp.]